jgi:hypothetical protein
MRPIRSLAAGLLFLTGALHLTSVSWENSSQPRPSPLSVFVVILWRGRAVGRAVTGRGRHADELIGALSGIFVRKPQKSQESQSHEPVRLFDK